MSNVKAQDLFDQVRPQFGMSGSHARFASDFVAAVNRTVKEMVLRGLIDGGSDIDGPEDTIPVDDQYEHALWAGTSMYLQKIGHQSAEKGADYASMFYNALKMVNMNFFKEGDITGKLGDLS